jgi:multicomponent Na+:H+ antiporter subunit D
VATSLLVSLLTLFSVFKIWSGVFWNPAEETPEAAGHAVGRLGGPVLMVVPTVALTLLGVAIAVGAGPLYDLSQRTAADLLEPSGYVRAVLAP